MVSLSHEWAVKGRLVLVDGERKVIDAVATISTYGNGFPDLVLYFPCGLQVSLTFSQGVDVRPFPALQAV